MEAISSFFKKAVVGEESKRTAAQFDTFEQVTAAKFDARFQLALERKGIILDSSNGVKEHPNYIADDIKAVIFKSIVIQKKKAEDLLESHVWPDQKRNPAIIEEVKRSQTLQHQTITEGLAAANSLTIQSQSSVATAGRTTVAPRNDTMDIPFVSKGEDEQTDMNNLTRLLEQLIDSEE